MPGILTLRNANDHDRSSLEPVDLVDRNALDARVDVVAKDVLQPLFELIEVAVDADDLRGVAKVPTRGTLASSTPKMRSPPAAFAKDDTSRPSWRFSSSLLQGASHRSRQCPN